MHFTLWPGLTERQGGHAEITWADFLAFLASPAVAAEKDRLEGWSPVRFRANQRAKANAEMISALVLDVDKDGPDLATLRTYWAGVAGSVHSSHSHDPDGKAGGVSARKWRVILRTSRDMTPDEHARVWAIVASRTALTLDGATKDPSRFWFVPAHRPEYPYEWAELEGEPLDVDALLTLPVPVAEPTPMLAGKSAVPPTLPASDGGPNRGFDSPDGGQTRRRVMAQALGAAWPAKGRHEAQLALAGALRGEGWAEADALEFLCDVCRAAGDEDRPKREATVRHTWGKPEGAALTGWTRLKAHVDGVLVDAVRGGIGRDAEWTEKTARRLAERAAAALNLTEPPAAPSSANADEITAGALRFKVGGLDAPLPPLTYTIEGLICRGDVCMLVAHGNSLKTWLAFSLALAVSTGRPWLARFPSMRGRAAIVDFESGDFEVVRRLKLLGAKDADVSGRLLRSSFSGANLTDPETWVALAGLGLELLVVDSFNAASPDTDENDARAAVMLQHAGRFANATGCTVIFIHHARKGAGGDRRETVRGSTALFAACDRIFEFVDLEKADGGVVRSTMRSVKDGAGKAPHDVRVELSDQGLHFVEASTEPEKPIKDKNRELVIEILRRNPAGIPQADLVNVMTGRREAKFQTLSQMSIDGSLRTFKDGGTKTTICMLSPGLLDPD